MGIGPFEREGAVETFDLAVGLGPVGAGELVNDVAEGSGEGHRPVAGSVIGYDTLDGDAVGGVKTRCLVSRTRRPWRLSRRRNSLSRPAASGHRWWSAGTRSRRAWSCSFTQRPGPRSASHRRRGCGPVSSHRYEPDRPGSHSLSEPVSAFGRPARYSGRCGCHFPKSSAQQTLSFQGCCADDFEK